jgi:hypothetical protein
MLIRELMAYSRYPSRSRRMTRLKNMSFDKKL